MCFQESRGRLSHCLDKMCKVAIVFGFGLSASSRSEAQTDQSQPRSARAFTAPKTDIQPTAFVRVEWHREGRKVDELWQFEANDRRQCLHVVVEGGRGRQEFDLLTGESVGPFVDLIARAHKLNGWYMIVVGVASLSAKSDGVEYRMLVSNVFPDAPPERGWMHTAALMIRDSKQPFQGMSISFPGGDSVFLGLHLLNRGGDRSDEITSHFFVNHCLVGDSTGKVLESASEHYECRVVGGESLTDFKDSNAPTGK